MAAASAVASAVPSAVALAVPLAVTSALATDASSANASPVAGAVASAENFFPAKSGCRNPADPVCEAAIADDLSMPRASASLFYIVKLAENEFKRVSKAADDPDCSVMPPLDLVGLASVQQALEKMDKVFGIFYDSPEEKGDGGVSANRNELLVPDDVMYLVAQRSAAKDAKNWELADSLRFKITALGFEVKDVKGRDPIVSRNFSNG